QEDFYRQQKKKIVAKLGQEGIAVDTADYPYSYVTIADAAHLDRALRALGFNSSLVQQANALLAPVMQSQKAAELS
ncbi:MAG: hypothetical protein KGJ06_06430, partial [Pseudomonadota bacterium]|nr:hypothetical protein [Pseudomonadota bacterium]